jgi:hypothetical protein
MEILMHDLAIPTRSKILRTLAATALFVVVLLAVNFVHMRWFDVNVVFYASLLDAAVAVLGMAVALLALSPFRAFNPFEKLQLIVVWALVGYAYAISVPTVIDRSLSFYILEKLEQRGGGIRKDAFERVFTDEYMKEHRLVDIRLTEQEQSGTIVIRDGCVKLTPKGAALAGFSRFYRTNLLPKKRLILDSYTDALTDPFRNSSASADYTCK